VSKLTKYMNVMSLWCKRKCLFLFVLINYLVF